MPGLIAAKHHVLDRGQPGEDACLLEGAGQAEALQAARVRTSYRASAKGQGARVGGLITGNHVESRCLARSIGSDEGGHGSFSDLEAALAESPDSPECLGQSLHCEQRAHPSSPPERMESVAT